MSSTLAWEPVVDIDYKTLPDSLKYIFIKKYGIQQGSYNLTSYDIEYLKGLQDGGAKELEKVISAIEKHGKVQIFLVC